MSEYSWRDRVDSETYWQSGLRELESENERLRKRVNELADELFKWEGFGNWVQGPNGSVISHEENREVVRKRIVDLQSQLAWHPVSEGLPTEDGAYEFADMLPSGKVRRFDLWVRRDDSWRHNPEEHWDYTHYRRIELPTGGVV